MSQDLCFTSATELARLIRDRAITCERVMRAHLDQIERVNSKINAIVTLLPDQAMQGAHEADRKLRSGEPIGPLHGLPVAHKDLLVTKGIRTTFGSPIYKDFVPDTDAIIVERLRAAGAITVGKTNTPEFGAGSQTFNRVFGPTRNPWDVTKTCGGSSGGAAAALACGMVPIADGSDFGGSLRNPASFCNVVGLRPAPGRVPAWPSYNTWFPLAVLGPMGRTVEDVALLLSVLAGPDPRAPTSISEAGSIFGGPLGRDFHGLRVAWSKDLGGLPVDPRVTQALEPGREVLDALGIQVVDAAPDLSDADEIFRVLRAYNFELTHGTLLDTRRDDLKDTVVWNIEEGRKLTGPQIGRAEVKRTELFHRMREFMKQYAFLAAPVVQVPPFDVDRPWVDEINGEKLTTYLDWMKSCYHISATGLPAISVPCGFTRDGLPVGLQIVGRHQDELGVLQLAYAFQQRTQLWKRRPPFAA